MKTEYWEYDEYDTYVTCGLCGEENVAREDYEEGDEFNCNYCNGYSIIGQEYETP